MEIEETEVPVVISTEEVSTDDKDINNRSVRFSGAPWYMPNIKVIVGGQGGIGSWLSIALSRQESELYTFDFDAVDETNQGGQFFNTGDIGKNKAEAMKEHIANFSANTNVTTFDKYDDDSFTGLIVFSAFDNMAARKLMYNKWKAFMLSDESEGKQGVFIDGRLLMESMKVFAVTRANMDKYESVLYDDGEIPDVDCAQKATTHCSMIIAGLMTGIYNNFLTNAKYKMNIREVPFLTEVELPTLTFNTSENEST